MQNSYDQLSEDQEENMRIENELMKIKFAAQYGDAFQMEGSEEISIALEHQFLKNIMAFEASYTHGNNITLYERIGKPPFQPVSSLKEIEIATALTALLDLLQQHQLHFDFVHGAYDDATIYRFITEELFSELVDKISVEGMRTGFIYEDFHPNHNKELARIAHLFLLEWFTRDFRENDWLISEVLISPDSVQLTREQMISKLRLFFDAFHHFADDGYNIIESNLDIHEGCEQGFGFVEGMLKYDAAIDNNESIHFEGPYKLYFQMIDKVWNVFYFVVPGFKW